MINKYVCMCVCIYIYRERERSTKILIIVVYEEFGVTPFYFYGLIFLQWLHIYKLENAVFICM